MHKLKNGPAHKRTQDRNCQDGFRSSLMQCFPIMHIYYNILIIIKEKQEIKKREEFSERNCSCKDRTALLHGWTPHVMNLTYFQAYFHNYIRDGGIGFCSFLVRDFLNFFCALRGFDFLKLERLSIFFYTFISFFLLCLMHFFFFFFFSPLLLNFSCNSDFFLSFSSLFLIAAFVKLKWKRGLNILSKAIADSNCKISEYLPRAYGKKFWVFFLPFLYF